MKELTIEVTNMCANHCKHCSTRAVLQEDAIFISRSKVREALDRFRDFEKVRFSGGEPFMHPGILNLFGEAKRRGRKVEVLTSGSVWGRPIPEATIKKSKELVDHFAFSLYGGDEQTHFQIVREFSFTALHESVGTVISNQIPFSFNFVAMNSSLLGLRPALEYAKKRASETGYCTPPFRILRFIKQGDGKGKDHESLNEKQIKRIMDYCNDAAAKLAMDIKFGCSFSKTGCTEGLGKAVLTVNGDYISCSALKYGAKTGQFACKERW